MSTRAIIAIAVPTGFAAIYLHSDGGSRAGWILADSYGDPARASELIALGDLSTLGPDLGGDGEPDRPGRCLAYGRDRGEEGTDAVISTTWADLLELLGECDAEHLHVYQGREWHHFGAAEVAEALEPSADSPGIAQEARHEAAGAGMVPSHQEAVAISPAADQGPSATFRLARESNLGRRPFLRGF